MDSRATYFVIALTVFLALFVAIASYYYLHVRRASREDWASLLKRLVAVDHGSIELIALDVLDESDLSSNQRNDSDLDPARIIALIGGLEGLEALAANSDVLIDLACYVQQWYPEALPVSEQLRLNAREIQWHLARLRGAARTGNLESAFPDYAQRAIATYYLMTRHLLTLYERGNLPGLTELQRAL